MQKLPLKIKRENNTCKKPRFLLQRDMNKENHDNTIEHHFEKMTLINTFSKPLSKSRKDHSIEAKSPLKIPSPKKQQQLTFRLAQTLPCETLPQNNNRGIEINEIRTPKLLSNFYQTQSWKTKNTPIIMSSTRSQGTSEQKYLEKMIQIAKILKQSSKIFNKDRLDQVQYLLLEIEEEVRQRQNTIQLKQTEKQIIPSKNISESKLVQQKFDQFFSSPSGLKEIKNAQQIKILDALESTPELELKKIIYMLDEKQKRKFHYPQYLSKNSSPSFFNDQFFESLSSFNQISQQEQSGFTLEEIERESSFGINEENASQRDLSKKQKEIILETEEKTHKKEVLNQIVSMLNKKYNKNIELN